MTYQRYEAMKRLLAVLALAALWTLGGCSDTDEDGSSGQAAEECTGDDCMEGVLLGGNSNQTVDNSNQTVDNSNQTVDNSNQTVDNSNQTVDNSNQTVEPVDPWEGCVYPEGPSAPAFDEAFPNLAWDVAFKPDGTEIKFSMREVYCSDEYANVETILFIASSGWCPNCPAYARYIDELSEAFIEANTLIVWMEVQDNGYNPASSVQAQAHFEQLVGQSPGIRVGDKDTLPNQAFDNNELVQAFPSQFVVRKRDMKVIVASSNSQYITPVLQVARHPEADWSDASNNVLPTNVGEACRSDADCDGGTLITYCLTSDDGWRRGYCFALGCEEDAACGEGNICAPAGDAINGCFVGCTDETEDEVCRNGYQCGRVSGLFGPKGCVP